MPEVVSCACGARIRLPERRSGQTLRCPRCKAEVAAPGDERIVTSIVADGLGQGATCPICQTVIGPGEAVVVCPTCAQVHHSECWDEVGGCATYGCPHAPQIEKPLPTATPLSAWGDTKKCPACGETIKSIALRCRYCKTDFQTVDPLTVHDLRGQVVREGGIRTARIFAIVVFVISIVLPCLAPLWLIVAIVFVARKRTVLARAGPIYVVMGYSSIAISLLYSILGAFLWISSE